MSGGDQAAQFVYLLGVLVLVGSAFLVRRIPIAQGLKMFAGWVLIFAAAYVIFTFRDDFRALGSRVLLDARGGVEDMQGGEVRIRQASDGHFWVTAQLNDQDVRFLIDSGATTTSVSGDTAARVGLRPVSRIGAMVQTANGVVVVGRGRADSLKVGSIERRDLAVHISPSADDVNVIGMNFLSSLSSWSVEGRILVLKA